MCTPLCYLSSASVMDTLRMEEMERLLRETQLEKARLIESQVRPAKEGQAHEEPSKA